MKTLSIGENKEELSRLLDMLESVDPCGEHWPALTAKRSRDFLEQYEVDTVFLDARVTDAQGVRLGEELAEKYPELNIVFMAEDEKYAGAAFRFYASEYMVKPVDEAAIRKAVAHLRHAVQVRKKPAVEVRCFGEFEVFYKGSPLRFKRSRTKELFAILICHRGAALSMGRLMSILWEDGEDTDSDRSYLRTLIGDLRQTFSAVGVPEAIIKGYNTLAVDPEQVDCDYYNFLKGRRRAVLSYEGEFMNQYSWAEYEFSHDDFL